METRGRGGRHLRSGVIVEILGAPAHHHYLVRWDDGKTSYVYPREVAEPVRQPERPERPPGPEAAIVGPMPERQLSLSAEPGDRLVVHGHRLGEPERVAEILEARGANGGPPFLVRWDDAGEESLLFPGSDAHVDHIVTRKRARQRRRKVASGK